MAYTTIDDPSAHFQIATYTGNGSTGQNIINDGNSDLQPDWVWAKRRDATTSHGLVDSSRGVRKVLSSNGTDAEYAESAGNTLTAFLSDGFTVGADGNYTAFNANGSSIVAWQWKANGGTTSSNTDGSITSTVQANTTAGFSIVLWTGSSASATIGHGLSSAPELVIVKNRTDSSTDWRIGNTVVSGKTMADDNGYYLEFDTGAIANPGGKTIWGSGPSAPTSTVFSVGSNNSNNGSSDNMLAYCFHSVKGYSKIGSYTGNGNADGPFVYLGFKPALLITKRTDATSDWRIWDFKRDPENVVDRILYPSANNGEGSETFGDFLSNGFKIRVTTSDYNASGGTYIYMAFAEHPFVSSEGVPVTAR